MNEQYIWQRDNWPEFIYDKEALLPVLMEVSRLQGQLSGMMKTLGFESKENATWMAISEDITKSSAIEGVVLDERHVRSSVANHLGLERDGLPVADYYTDGVVQITIDAINNYLIPITSERLFGWNAALFPSGYSSIYKIHIGGWRISSEPMMIVSGAIGHERIHYIAPPVVQVDQEMDRFITWINEDESHHPLIKAAIAHLWFVAIHPFDDGNGRIARAITDYLLAKADGGGQRYYSISAAICKNRDSYYEILEQTSIGDVDITSWVKWFLSMLSIALAESIKVVEYIVRKSLFWNRHGQKPLNERQIKVINKLWDGFDGKLNNSKWVKITHCSPATALRDLQQLVDWGILVISESRGRSTNYVLVEGEIGR